MAVHVDGLEWKRAKWGRRASDYYRWAEARSARWADAIIADAQGIADHICRTPTAWPRTASPTAPRSSRPDTDAAGRAGRDPGGYHLVVARLEPENHVREIVAGYVHSAGPAAAAGGR